MLPPPCVSTLRPRVSLIAPRQNHRWVPSLGGYRQATLNRIRRPSEEKMASAAAILARGPFFWVSLAFHSLYLQSPLPHTLLLSDMHISDQAWMSGGAWELLISGSVLAASCLRIQTNKGQRESRSGADKGLSFYLHTPPPVCCLSSARCLERPSTHPRTHFFFFVVCFSLNPCLSLSLSLSSADLWSRLGSQNTSKQLLSNGPLLKQSVERPDERWLISDKRLDAFLWVIRSAWTERERERLAERKRETYRRIGKAVCTTRPGIYLMSRRADNL